MLDFEKLIEGKTNNEINRIFMDLCRGNWTNTLDIQKFVDYGVNPRMDDDEPFITVCEYGNSLEIILYFLKDLGIDPNVRNGEALQRAIGSHYGRTAKFLLDNGAIVTDAVIEEAVEYDGDEMIKIFLDYGVEPNRITPSYSKSLKNSISKYQLRMMHHLRKTGVSYEQIFDQILEDMK